MLCKPVIPAAFDLRRRAERKLGSHAAVSALSEAQVRRMVHELQVHQIELEMQNEELLQAEARAREALQELAAVNSQLEHRVADRTAELASACEAAEAASRAKSLFLSSISHELRTPMSGVLGMIELARRSASDATQIDWLGKAEHSALHLLSVINDVLDVSKIEAGRLSLSIAELTLPGILDDVTNLLASQVAEKGLRFSVILDPAVADRPLRGDAVRLLQILLNLAGNAVKFTDEGSVTVTARLAQKTPAGVRVMFEVADSGIGIAPSDQPRLFNAFEQADARLTRRHGGTGLGLAISKRLAAMMGGEIGVLSQPGAGSVFWFTALLGHVGAGEAIAPLAPLSDAEAMLQAAHPGARVLLAEDDPVNQEVICCLLGHAGLRVDVAGDGSAAVELARLNEYALILMDMQMPVMGGLDAAHEIRLLHGRADVPIIAMTASVFADDHERCLQAGMNDHLGKPVPAELLFGKLLQWLERPRLSA